MNNNEIKFPNYFADAETDYQKAKYVIYGIPYDKTSSFRYGSSKGPDAIRQASWNFESYNIINDIDFVEIPTHDFGNIENIEQENPESMIETVSHQISKFVNEKKIPVGIGGEHSATAGIIKSFQKNIHILLFDAHLDFRESYENEAYNHACTIRRIIDYLPIDHVHVVGVRSAEKNEYQDAIEKKLDFYDMNSVNKKGIEYIITQLQNKLNNNPIYISIDIDAIDPGFAPGTGTPEPFGLLPKDILSFFDVFSKSLIGFDIMEVNPLFDHGQTASLAAKYVRYGIEKIHKK